MNAPIVKRHVREFCLSVSATVTRHDRRDKVHVNSTRSRYELGLVSGKITLAYVFVGL